MNRQSAHADLIDSLIQEWGEESAELNPEAMSVIGRIIRLGRQFESDAAGALKPFGLHYTDFDIIATLKRSGEPYELTPGELSKAVLLTSGAMTAALDRLQYAELLTRHASQLDRRVKSAKLTPKGQGLALEAAEARFNIAEQALSGLSKSERLQTVSLLKKLAS